MTLLDTIADLQALIDRAAADPSAETNSPLKRSNVGSLSSIEEVVVTAALHYVIAHTGECLARGSTCIEHAVDLVRASSSRADETEPS